MKKILNNKNIIIIITIAISFLLMILSYFVSNKILSLISLALLFISLVFDSILNLKEKYLLLLFYGTFFLFSMGQYYFSGTTDWLHYTNYKINTIKLTILIQWLALLFTFLSFNISNKFIKIRDKKAKDLNIINNKVLMIILTFIYIITIIVNLETGYRVIKYGYLVIYNNSIQSILPSGLKYLSTFFPLIIFICLSIFKERKYCYTVLVLYFLYLCFTLMTGVRGEFGIGILLIIMYLFVYEFIINRRVVEKKLLIRGGIILVVLIPICAITLNIFNSLRNNDNVDNFNLYNQFQSFFVNQGSSVNLISMAIENEEEFKKNETMYVFGPFLENVENKILKITNGIEFKFLENKSTSFAVDASKFELGEDGYNSGQGLGSQYLAEVYIDYGFIGIILCSIVIGLMLYIVGNFYKYNILGSSLSLLTIQSILYLPRGQAIQPLNAVLSVNYWILIFLIYIFIILKKFLKRRKNYV